MTRKELAKIRKENVKAKKKYKAVENWCKKIEKRNWDAYAWYKWQDAKKCSNNWRKTR